MFRGAFIKELGGNVSPLFHNHTDNGLVFSYPLIQYKVISGNPVLVGIGDGAGLLSSLRGSHELTIGKEKRLYDVAGVSIMPYRPDIDDSPKMYTIQSYIPLNADNIGEFDSLPALTDRICLIENIINANMLAFFKGIGFHCDSQIQTAVSSVDKECDLYYKGVKFLGFDLSFITNVSLPDGIGLGKSSSVGFGTIKRVDIPQRYQKTLSL